MWGTPTVKDSSHAQSEPNAMCKIKREHCLLADNVGTEFLSDLQVHCKGLLQDKCIWVKDCDVVAPVCQQHDGHHTNKKGCPRRLKVHFIVESPQAFRATA